jgi:uncharacterized phage protein (TIGR01671 family)
MSRPIKFRAWNTDDEEMYPVISVDFEDGMCEVDGDGLALSWRGIPEVEKRPEAILMQFTGLHDKNGKEIYEGDIVVGALNNGMGAKTTWAVAWNDDKSKWAVKHHRIQNLMGITRTSSKTMLVIGNMYETPELLS